MLYFAKVHSSSSMVKICKGTLSECTTIKDGLTCVNYENTLIQVSQSEPELMIVVEKRKMQEEDFNKIGSSRSQLQKKDQRFYHRPSFIPIWELSNVASLICVNFAYLTKEDLALRSSSDHSSGITLECACVDSEHTKKTNGEKTYKVKSREAGPVSAVDEPFAISPQAR